MLQTVAQMLARIGIQAKVESMPAAVYFGRRTKLEFSAGMAGWGGGIGSLPSYLKALVASFNPKICAAHR